MFLPSNWMSRRLLLSRVHICLEDVWVDFPVSEGILLGAFQDLARANSWITEGNFKGLGGDHTLELLDKPAHEPHGLRTPRLIEPPCWLVSLCTDHD